MLDEGLKLVEIVSIINVFFKGMGSDEFIKSDSLLHGADSLKYVWNEAALHISLDPKEWTCFCSWRFQDSDPSFDSNMIEYSSYLSSYPRMARFFINRHMGSVATVSPRREIEALDRRLFYYLPFIRFCMKYNSAEEAKFALERGLG